MDWLSIVQRFVTDMGERRVKNLPGSGRHSDFNRSPVDFRENADFTGRRQ
jgi:hypothetical protein